MKQGAAYDSSSKEIVRASGIVLALGGGISGVLSYASLKKAIRKHNDQKTVIY
jgi:hypothetical protein